MGKDKGTQAAMNPQTPPESVQIARELREALSAMQVALEVLRRPGDEKTRGQMLALLERQLAQLKQLADRCMPADQAAPAAEAAPAAASDGGARRILLVDDNVDSAEVLGALLEQMGHEVFVAYTGARALEMAHERRPDVVFLDLALPDISGFDVALGIRKDAGLAAARIVGLTGFGSEEHRRRATECGIDQYLVKPVEATTLMEVLKKSA